MPKTLLEQAKEIKLYRKTKREYGKEEMEIVLAWLKSEVAFVQIKKVIICLSDGKPINYNKK